MSDETDIKSVTLLDTHTGKKWTVKHDPPINFFWWWLGNGSCDCNRAIFFSSPDDEEDKDYEEEQRLALGLEEGICLGDKRWLICEAESVNGPVDKKTIRELNEHYPEELVNQWLP